MKFLQTFTRYLLFIMVIFIGHTTLAQNSQPPPDDEEFNLFLAVFGLVAVSVMAGFAIITVMLAALVLFCMASLIGAGMLSASVGVGIYQKSFMAGIRMAGILSLALICGIGGAAAGWLLDKVFEFSASGRVMAMIGGGAGALGGVVGALTIFWLIRKLLGKIHAGVKKTDIN